MTVIANNIRDIEEKHINNSCNNSTDTDNKQKQFLRFSFKAITTKYNKDGVEKKVPIGMPNWRSISKTTLHPHHQAQAIICGKPSNITVFDFDDREEYEKILLLKTVDVSSAHRKHKTHCQQDEVVQLLKQLHHSRCDNYDSWVQVGLLLHHELGYEEGLEVYKNWSSLSVKYDEQEVEAKWNSFKENTEKPLTILSLLKWVHEDNPLSSGIHIHTLPVHIQQNLYNSTHLDVAKLLHHLHQHTYIYTGERSPFYRFNGVTWQEAVPEIVLRRHLDELLLLYEEMMKENRDVLQEKLKNNKKLQQKSMKYLSSNEKVREEVDEVEYEMICDAAGRIVALE